jgi:hypothetical protein
MQIPKLNSMHTIVTLAMAAGLMVAVPSPASAGQSVCMWIGSAFSGNGNIRIEQNCGVNGTYHMDIWGAGHPRTHTRDYQFKGFNRETFNWNIPKRCGGLWRALVP